MMKDNKVFDPPNGNPDIWRFIDNSKFLWIVQNSSLYFPRVDNFPDPYEGRPPVHILQSRIDNLLKKREKVNENLTAEQVNELLPEVSVNSVLSEYEYFRKITFANCWYCAGHESVAMWKQYLASGDGVAIKTNYDDLVASLESTDEYDTYATKIAYEDYDQFQPDGRNIFEYYITKPQQYEYENELRLIIISAPPETEHSENSSNSAIERCWDEQPSGISINVDLDMLIQEVRISPYSPPWVTEEYIQEILSIYGISANVEESVVNQDFEQRIKLD